MFGTIWLKIKAILNHDFSIIKDVFDEKTPSPDRIRVKYRIFLFFRKRLKTNNPKTIVSKVKDGLDFKKKKKGCI